MINDKQIAEEYKEFADIANELAGRDVSLYPLKKREVKHDRYLEHIISMLTMHGHKYQSRTTRRVRLETLQEILNWMVEKGKNKPILIPDLESYLLTHIKDLEKDLDGS